MSDQVLLTTTVGSFGKPDYLQKGRNANARGKLGDSELFELERKATEEWIRRQERLDIDILVDGEMYRGDMVAYFAERLEGFKLGGLVRSYGNRYYHKPIIASPVSRPKPMTVDWFRYTQSLTDRPVKGCSRGRTRSSTGPTTRRTGRDAMPRSRSRRSCGRRPRTSRPQARATSRSTSRRSTRDPRRSRSRSRRWGS
jgi:methionine synthase II (cobalamin-independent)